MLAYGQSPERVSHPLVLEFYVFGEYSAYKLSLNLNSGPQASAASIQPEPPLQP